MHFMRIFQTIYCLFQMESVVFPISSSNSGNVSEKQNEIVEYEKKIWKNILKKETSTSLRSAVVHMAEKSMEVAVDRFHFS